jgi:hypothetical protein
MLHTNIDYSKESIDKLIEESQTLLRKCQGIKSTVNSIKLLSEYNDYSTDAPFTETLKLCEEFCKTLTEYFMVTKMFPISANQMEIDYEKMIIWNKKMQEYYDQLVNSAPMKAYCSLGHYKKDHEFMN